MATNNISYKIRKMTVDDAMDIQNLNVDQFTIIYPTAIYVRHVKHFPTLSLVLDIDNNLEGFIIGSNTVSEGVLYGHISSIYVSEGFRRRGFGKKLMDQFEESSRLLKCKYVNLFVNDRNTSAIEFYKRLNYYINSTIPKYYNDNEDAFEMRKTLI